MNPLILNNSWMNLVVVLKNQIHTIKNMVIVGSKVPNDKIVVAKMFGFELLANKDEVCKVIATHEDGFFIKCDNLFFELGSVEDSVDDANTFCKRNEGFSVIASDKHGNHFLTRNSKSFSI